MNTNPERIRARLFLLAILVIGSSTWGCIQREPSLAERAEQQIARHEYTLAEATLTEAIEAEPANDALILRRGRVRMANKNWEGAEADFSTYIERQPSDMAGYLNLANSLERQGREGEARQNRNAARILDPYRDESESLYAQLPDSPRENQENSTSDTTEKTTEETEPTDELSQSENDQPERGQAIELPPTSGIQSRFDQDPSVAGFEKPILPFQNRSSNYDHLFPEDENKIDPNPLEDLAENNREEDSRNDLGESDEPATTTYRWNDYLRKNNLDNAGVSGRNLLPTPSRPLSTGINPRLPSHDRPSFNPSGSITHERRDLFNPRPPLTTGIQSSRGSRYPNSPTTSLPSRENTRTLPFERPAPPTTGIHSGSRP